MNAKLIKKLNKLLKYLHNKYKEISIYFYFSKELIKFNWYKCLFSVWALWSIHYFIIKVLFKKIKNIFETNFLRQTITPITTAITRKPQQTPTIIRVFPGLDTALSSTLKISTVGFTLIPVVLLNKLTSTVLFSAQHLLHFCWSIYLQFR